MALNPYFSDCLLEVSYMVTGQKNRNRAWNRQQNSEIPRDKIVSD